MLANEKRNQFVPIGSSKQAIEDWVLSNRVEFQEGADEIRVDQDDME